jgi:hypothetical protein
MGFIVRERLSLKIGFQAFVALSAVHRFETFREWACRCVAAQSQNLIPLEKRFDGSAKTCPKLHLPGNRAFHEVTRYAGIKNKSIGELYRLTHSLMVAYCYLKFWGERDVEHHTLPGRPRPFLRFLRVFEGGSAASEPRTAPSILSSGINISTAPKNHLNLHPWSVWLLALHCESHPRFTRPRLQQKGREK